ncbi:putative quinate permease [Pseudocercospora fuligena]|uniref:Putative quinate permease n=1 Tax=Pseudocercospora fuligena TaxID=685502 RepID=A0A8H6RQK0_9PEZI|nr:putative quinate permease [Pseudocercospora fuligena]
MAGGTSIWVSKDAKTDPKQIFNGRLLYLLITLAWAGCFYGFDSGNIGGILTLPSFENAFGLSGLSQEALDKRSGTIAAMLAAGGSAGALCAWPTADFLGRKWSVFLWGIVFLIGATMQMISDYDVLLAGRFIGGMGVGASSMLSPQFLAENAPKSVRGSMTATYNLMIILSLALAFWINYCVSLWHNAEHNDTQWRLAMGIQLIPGAMMCLMIPFIPETPRYLINCGKSEQGLKNLTRLRKLPPDHPYIQTEYQEIEAQVRFEQEAHRGHNVWVIVQDIFTNKSNAQRFFLAVMLFLFHKFTGTDSLNYYAPSINHVISFPAAANRIIGIFKLIGVKGNSNTLLTTGVYGIVKLVTTIFYVGYLVDRIGRRLPLLIGASIQATAMLYLALYIRFAGGNASEDTVGGTPAGGIVGIVFIYLYAFGWSFGHSVACYVVAAEIFPTRIRAFCMSFCFFVNWIVDYGITKATAIMLTEMGWGTFLLYAMLTYGGVVFVYFCLPELKGRSIESMDDLFQKPLWTMWRHAYPTEEEKIRSDVQDMIHAGKLERGDSIVEKSGAAIHVEKASD